MKANLRTIALAAIPMMSMTEVVMASSLLLPNAAQLAGRWQLYPEQQQAQACEGAQRYAWTTPDGKQLVLERLDK